jgi:hypothetical protein
MAIGLPDGAFTFPSGGFHGGIVEANIQTGKNV